jgi:hypothetical protein
MSVCLRYSKLGERRIAAFAVWPIRNIAPKRKNYRPARQRQLPGTAAVAGYQSQATAALFLRRREGAWKLTPSPPRARYKCLGSPSTWRVGTRGSIRRSG